MQLVIVILVLVSQFTLLLWTSYLVPIEDGGNMSLLMFHELLLNEMNVFTKTSPRPYKQLLVKLLLITTTLHPNNYPQDHHTSHLKQKSEHSKHAFSPQQPFRSFELRQPIRHGTRRNIWFWLPLQLRHWLFIRTR